MAEVVVVGAGIAGLVATSVLHQRDVDDALFEDASGVVRVDGNPIDRPGWPAT